MTTDKIELCATVGSKALMEHDSNPTVKSIGIQISKYSFLLVKEAQDAYLRALKTTTDENYDIMLAESIDKLLDIQNEIKKLEDDIAVLSSSDEAKAQHKSSASSLYYQAQIKEQENKMKRLEEHLETDKAQVEEKAQREMEEIEASLKDFEQKISVKINALKNFKKKKNAKETIVDSETTLLLQKLELSYDEKKKRNDLEHEEKKKRLEIEYEEKKQKILMTIDTQKTKLKIQMGEKGDKADTDITLLETQIQSKKRRAEADIESLQKKRDEKISKLQSKCDIEIQKSQGTIKHYETELEKQPIPSSRIFINRSKIAKLKAKEVILDRVRHAKITKFDYEQKLKTILCAADSVANNPKEWEFAKRVLCRLIMLMKAEQLPFKVEDLTQIISDYIKYNSEEDNDYHSYCDALVNEKHHRDVQIQDHKTFSRVLDQDIPYDIMNAINTYIDDERKTSLQRFGLTKVEDAPVYPRQHNYIYNEGPHSESSSETQSVVSSSSSSSSSKSSKTSSAASELSLTPPPIKLAGDYTVDECEVMISDRSSGTTVPEFLWRFSEELHKNDAAYIKGGMKHLDCFIEALIPLLEQKQKARKKELRAKRVAFGLDALDE
ncbi:MAG: hypothetical protein EBU96_06425 [Actinobacteria bacterium]|nr:hypothetical protein [Actinomycetota bacterium]